ncbi:MAG TPA: YdcF family protein [Acetobacteraceae bacterium]|nr:YdcF family protein [Acetobacteraceae bacterium]
MRKTGLILRVAGGTVLAAAVAWLGGLVWFVHIATRPVPPPPDADGIVALTGGADRVAAALRLLREHRAPRLLLSGIGGGAELPGLARTADVDPPPPAGEVTLGRQAISTRGNALETAAWVQRHDIKSLIVVTAFYHMPRAMTELRRTLPGVTLYPDPVLTPHSGGIGRVVTLRLIAEEYTKYLLSVVGVTDLVPDRTALAPQRAHPG